MGTHQTIIRDNFLANPKGVVNFANQLEYWQQKDGKWPGTRTLELSDVNPNFKNKICQEILKNYYSLPPQACDIRLYFQKVKPYHEDQYHPYNLGWVHVDHTIFGGIIYLDEEPEDDTGTTLYDLENHFHDYPDVYENAKRRHYLSDDTLSEDEYTCIFNEYHQQFSQSIIVANKFNRLVSFSGDQFHGLQTTGTKERLTLVFFCRHLTINDNEYYQSVRLF
jgi:hypothetical protein